MTNVSSAVAIEALIIDAIDSALTLYAMNEILCHLMLYMKRNYNFPQLEKWEGKSVCVLCCTLWKFSIDGINRVLASSSNLCTNLVLYLWFDQQRWRVLLVCLSIYLLIRATFFTIPPISSIKSLPRHSWI